MKSRSLFSGFLFTAGLLHLVRPDLFSPALPVEGKLALNWAAGLLEILLALALWSTRWRDLAARGAALWFLLLTPLHLYVSYYGIAIFGIETPALLWGRTALQPLLFFWALSLQEKGWIMAQRWTEVLFLHYEVEASELQKHVPYPLDLYEGKAVLSIVPFIMSRIRFPFLPAVPGLSRLYELNLRTYVTHQGRGAVYFFTLDSNHLPGVCIARWFFGLPYRWRRLVLEHKETYRFESDSLQLEAQVEEGSAESEFNRWATERYALVTDSGKVGVVEHAPWVLQKASVRLLKDEFSVLLGEQFRVQSFVGISYAKQLDVRFRPFRSGTERRE